MTEIDSYARGQADLLRARIEELEGRVAALDGQTSSAARAASNVDPRIVDALREGKTIEAITIYRQLTGADLMTAKTAVEQIAASI
jgi:ribosomal protein L7/L12